MISVVILSLSRVQHFATPWAITNQAPLPVGFSRQENWSRLSFPSPGSFPTQGLNPHLLHWEVDSLPLSHQGSPLNNIQFSSVQSLSRVQLCDPMNHSAPGLPVYHQLPEFTQTHVHRVGDAMQPSHPLSSPSPLALSLSQHQSLFQWVTSSWIFTPGAQSIRASASA